MIQKVVPQATGESSKVKVKVRMNIHGIFSVSSASLVEVLKSEEAEEPMDTEQTTSPTTEKEEEVLHHYTSRIPCLADTFYLFLYFFIFVHSYFKVEMEIEIFFLH